MRIAICLAAACLVSVGAYAKGGGHGGGHASASSDSSGGSSHSVRGYVKKDGTYVEPHRATDADSSKLNNWSAKGNTNPYTGKEGTVDPYKPTPKN